MFQLFEIDLHAVNYIRNRKIMKMALHLSLHLKLYHENCFMKIILSVLVIMTGKQSMWQKKGTLLKLK